MRKIIGAIIAVAIAGGIAFVLVSPDKPGVYDAFAACITDSGAAFYGAFWCPHCADQKKMFGKSSKLLPYVECSTPDGKAMLPSCIEKGVKGFPTWVFADGSRLEGTIPLDRLAEKTSCTLPA